MKISRGCFALSLLIAVGCSESSGPDALAPEDIRGLWAIPLTKTANCSTNGSPNTVTVYLQMDVETDGDAAGSRFGFSEATAASRLVTGTVDLRSGELDFILRHISGNAASHLYGTLTKEGEFSGTFVDPALGFQPQITLVGCEYSAVGTLQ